jgi:hypothetical protein
MDTTAGCGGTTLLDPKDVHLELDRFQDLTLALRSGTRYTQVKVVPALPLSGPCTYVAFQDRDGREIGFLRDARSLDRKSLAVLEGELDKAYYLPIVTRIYNVERSFPGYDWHVETDRGERRLKLRFQRESRSIGEGRVLLVDVEGMKYLIRNSRRLDERSQRFIEEFIY